MFGLSRSLRKISRNGPKRPQNGRNPTKNRQNAPFSGSNCALTGAIFEIKKICHQTLTLAPKNAMLTFVWVASQTPFPTKAKHSELWAFRSRIPEARTRNVSDPRFSAPKRRPIKIESLATLSEIIFLGK